MTPAAARGRGTLRRLLPPGPAAMRRTPFVLLVVFLLGSGLIALLLLNSSINQGSFELTRLQRRTTELTDQQQALQQEVDQLAAPDALERRARELGLVPGGSPAFLDPDGTVRGVPAPAPAAGGTPEDPAAYAPGAAPPGALPGRAPGGTPPGAAPRPAGAVNPAGAVRPAGPGTPGTDGPPVTDPAFQPYRIPGGTAPDGQGPALPPYPPSQRPGGRAPAPAPYPQSQRPGAPAPFGPALPPYPQFQRPGGQAPALPAPPRAGGPRPAVPAPGSPGR
ncbi:septum formation initiator family protein [Streptomyces caatingaensis]|uniref:Cell division protein FtsL n=1 Tax=Streptomyces caatingaensis TaxID=1678637 RepID=A0A0K9XI46_9ACTN|nr:hypothetical protein AC230_08600 [Streptomyces caatingaensis]